jgi:hypothetical protein
VDFERTDVSEKSVAFIIRMKIFSELGTTLAVTNNRNKLRKICSFELSVLTRSTRPHLLGDGILQNLSSRRNLYDACYCFHADFLLALFSETENGGGIFLRKAE